MDRALVLVEAWVTAVAKMNDKGGRADATYVMGWGEVVVVVARDVDDVFVRTRRMDKQHHQATSSGED